MYRGGAFNVGRGGRGKGLLVCKGSLVHGLDCVARIALRLQLTGTGRSHRGAGSRWQRTRGGRLGRGW